MSRSADAVDVHAHFFPESFLKVIADHGDVFGASIDRSSAKGPVIVMAGSRTPPLDASYWDPDRRLKAMNRQGVGVHALSLTVPMAYWADGELGSRLAGAFNDALAQAHTAHPDRFVGCATLPVIGVARLKPFYLANLLGNPFDIAVAAAHLVLGGVLDRFPKLEICLPHAGGAMPYLVGRLQHGQRVRPRTRGWRSGPSAPTCGASPTTPSVTRRRRCAI